MTDEKCAPADKDDSVTESELAKATFLGSGISETKRVKLDPTDNPDLLAAFAEPWAENQQMIRDLFTPILERSFLCPGAECAQCCQANDGEACAPNWQEREDPEWYAREINQYFTLVNDRVAQPSHLTRAVTADEAFELGCLFTEALIKFRWDKRAKRGEKGAQGSRLGGEMRRHSNPSRLSREDTIAQVNTLLLQGHPKEAAYAMAAEQQKVSAQTVAKEYQGAKKVR